MTKKFILNLKHSKPSHVAYLMLLGIHALFLYVFSNYTSPFNNESLLFVYAANSLGVLTLIRVFLFTCFIDAFSYKHPDESAFTNNVRFYNLDPTTLSLYNVWFVVYKLLPFLIITLIIDASLVNFGYFVLSHTPIIFIAFIIPLATHTKKKTTISSDDLAPHAYRVVEIITLRWLIINHLGWMLVGIGLLLSIANAYLKDTFAPYFITIGLVLIAIYCIKLYSLVRRSNYEIHN